MPDRCAAIVLDIEGTTTPIAFVHEVLFPYARKRLPVLIRNAQAHPEARAALARLATDAGRSELSADEAIEKVLALADADSKTPVLKTLQGITWREGFQDGSLITPLYEDVFAALKAWKARGLSLYIYSSGSVEAQRLLFAHTNAGDLSSLFAGWFDATIGAKTAASSYESIAAAIGAAPAALLFVSDHVGEVAAARQAGWRSLLIDRSDHPVAAAIRTFADIEV